MRRTMQVILTSLNRLKYPQKFATIALTVRPESKRRLRSAPSPKKAGASLHKDLGAARGAAPPCRRL